MIWLLAGRLSSKESSVKRKDLILCQHIIAEYSKAMQLKGTTTGTTHRPSGAADDASVQSAHTWHDLSRDKPAIKGCVRYVARR